MSSEAYRSHRRWVFLLVIFVAAAGSLILYRHGAGLWYAPLAVGGIVLAHVVVLGVIAFFASRVARPHGGEHAHTHQGLPIRWPRLYDWMVQLLTLGRERRFRRRILDLADLRSGDRALDVGCGTGTLLIVAAQRVGPSGSLFGVDTAPEMIAHAHRKVAALAISLDLTKGSAAALPYPVRSFDVVFCTMALHHVAPPLRDAAVREMHRVLRPGGRVVIVDLQPPRSFLRALSLVTLLHRMGPGGSPTGVLDIEPLMTQLGFDQITRHSFGVGAIGAVVARVPEKAGA